MSQRSGGVAAWLLLACVAFAAAPGSRAADTSDPGDLLRFGAEMAREGNWREARFRWERAVKLAPADARILNNLAVASEALGEPEPATDLYQRAAKLAPNDEAIAENAERHRAFLSRSSAAPESADASASPPGGDEHPAKEIKGSKKWKVTVRLPIPARLDVSNMKTVLVASFLVPGEELLDLNREAVRFVRSEFRKRSTLSVLEVTPAPAVPEQTIDDLAANAEFWKHLGREHGADLIVSGEVVFTKADASGFREVDSISPVTGQKVRQTRFVEQERFDYAMDVLFLDGTTGGLLYRDRLRKSSVYTGLGNDPITAFYDLIEATAADVRGAVSAGTREETRYVFRK